MAGWPYRCDHGAMSELPEGPEKTQAIRTMFDRIAPRYDLVNRVMTLGMDIRWRRRTVEALELPAASTVLDVACGTGDLCVELGARRLLPVGLDMSWGMLLTARTSAPLVQADALAMPFPDGAFDGAVCGFALRNVADLGKLFAECHRVIRHGGRLSLLEVAEPERAMPRRLHALYFRRAVPLIGRLLSDKDAYRYLPRSTAYLPSPPELLAMITDSGFTDVRRRLVGFGAAQIFSATRNSKSTRGGISLDQSWTQQS